MFASPYELIDFGEGRKLEKFGETLFDRPTPLTNDFAKKSPEMWESASFRFNRTSPDKGNWQAERSIDKVAPLQFEHFRIQLKTTPAGQVGVFPEQIPNWQWIRKQILRRKEAPRVLNLFAYTGGSTLAASAAGAEVVHVDSARNIVTSARANAELSQLGQNPIRWMVEDASRFVQRECKRGNRYDAIILDPPTYGHGPKGETWKIQTDLMPLLNDCKKLLSDNPLFILLSCHTPELEPAELQAMVADSFFGSCSSGALATALDLKTKSGRKLSAGIAVRWSNY